MPRAGQGAGPETPGVPVSASHRSPWVSPSSVLMPLPLTWPGGPLQLSGPTAMDLPRSGGKLAGWAPHAASAGPGRERLCLTGGAGDGQQLAPNLELRPLPPGHGAHPGGHTAKTLTRPSHPTGCRSGWWCPGRDSGVRPPARPQAPLKAVSHHAGSHHPAWRPDSAAPQRWHLRRRN